MVTFTPETHEYRHGGERIPSVTQIIGAVLGTPSYATDWHMARGSAAHALYELLAQGEDLAEYEYDSRLQGYVDGWQAWFKAEEPEFIETEMRLHHPHLRYAGTCDAVVRIKGRVTLIDYKATCNPVRDALQLGAYSLAMPTRYRIRQAAVLEIREDGQWRYALRLKGIDLVTAQNNFKAVRLVARLKEEA